MPPPISATNTATTAEPIPDGVGRYSWSLARKRESSPSPRGKSAGGEGNLAVTLAEVRQVYDPALADGSECTDSERRGQQAVPCRRTRPDRPTLADAGCKLPHQRAVAGVVLLLLRRKLLDRR